MNEHVPYGIAIGDRLTDYNSADVEVQRIASGGFGIVYLGPNSLEGGKWRALKTLRPDVLTSSGRAYDQFVREGLTWVGLWPHPNLLTAVAVTHINTQPFLVLNYAPRGSLRDLFTTLHRQRFWMSPDIALIFAQQIAAGLVALHTPDPAFLRYQPIVHRDLKPENVLLQENGVAMITDFGLAKVMGANGEDNPTLLGHLAVAQQLGDDGQSLAPNEAATRSRRYQTARGVALGTVAYMAPEQWMDAASAGPPADIYAFGLLLGELFTGRHPLLDLESPHSVAEWREAHRSGRPLPLAFLLAQNASAPVEASALMAAVEGLYRACLDKQAEARPTATEALTRLQQVAQRFGEDPYVPSEIVAHTVENEVIIWNNWADTFNRLGFYKEALERNDHALALDLTDPETLNTRSNILAHLGRPEEALATYDQALAALSPADRRRKVLWNGRAICLKGLGRFAEAEEAYAQALALDDTDADIWYNRANNQARWGAAEAQAGLLDAAVIHWRTGVGYAERAVALTPHNPEYHHLLDAIRDVLS